VDNIKMDLGKIGFGRGVIDWISLIQDMNKRRALVNAVMKLKVP
jgi:hypothetical protein